MIAESDCSRKAQVRYSKQIKKSGRRSALMPARAVALFFGDFLRGLQCLLLAVLADCSKKGIEQGHRRGIRRAIRIGFNSREKCLMAGACKRRQARVADADTVRSTRT